MNSLLTREEFKKQVFLRDNNKCVVCRNAAVDAHHILERRLFVDGGYYIDNGASVCGECHLKCEQTVFSVEILREFCKITNKIIPEHLYPDQIYDKWGNPILPNGRRLMGELFDDPSVQKALKYFIDLGVFTKYVKYPRTYHLPWSEGISSDDRIIKSLDNFEDKNVVVTVKMDGENTTMYNDYIHSRSLNDKPHWSKSWIKNFHAVICNDIPESYRLVVENLYAKHSIHYKNLRDYCYGISIWENLKCLAWNDTVDYFQLLGINTPEILYQGTWDKNIIESLYSKIVNGDECEGYVVRVSDSFHYKDFSKCVAKFVRKNHITSENHWFHGKIGIKNEKL